MPRATVIAYTNWTLRGNPFSKKTPTLQLLSDSSPHSADKRHLITKPCNSLKLWVKQNWLIGLRSNAESFRRWLSKIRPKMPLPRFTGREWSWQRLTTDRLLRSVRSHFLSSSFICFQQFIRYYVCANIKELNNEQKVESDLLTTVSPISVDWR